MAVLLTSTGIQAEGGRVEKKERMVEERKTNSSERILGSNQRDDVVRSLWGLEIRQRKVYHL